MLRVSGRRDHSSRSLFQDRRRQCTALVGSSGAGKTTVANLICAFHKPSRGRILVDGVDLSTVKLGSYRPQLGVVLQEPYLFHASIRDNVLYCNRFASDEQFSAACRVAGVDSLAEGLPDRYDTMIGDRGLKLSGGQRQRIAIARATLANPRILILDEATSSLDIESEMEIQESLNRLMKGRTTFVIAHRLSTIIHADQILVIQNGRLIEHGNHDALCRLGGRYHEIYTKQEHRAAHRGLVSRSNLG